MLPANIILTGFMATGKSTLGRLLAKRLGYHFVDTDAEIEKRTGMRIDRIFASQGEAVFRNLEKQLVRELAAGQEQVIATGGGLVMNPDNVTALEKNGRIVCLTATPEDILARANTQRQTRPLLNSPDPQQRIAELLAERTPVYRQFPQLDTSRLSREELVESLLALLSAG